MRHNIVSQINKEPKHCSLVKLQLTGKPADAYVQDGDEGVRLVLAESLPSPTGISLQPAARHRFGSVLLGASALSESQPPGPSAAAAPSAHDSALASATSVSSGQQGAGEGPSRRSFDTAPGRSFDIPEGGALPGRSGEASAGPGAEAGEDGAQSRWTVGNFPTRFRFDDLPAVDADSVPRAPRAARARRSSVAGAWPAYAPGGAEGGAGPGGPRSSVAGASEGLAGMLSEHLAAALQLPAAGAARRGRRMSALEPPSLPLYALSSGSFTAAGPAPRPAAAPLASAPEAGPSPLGNLLGAMAMAAAATAAPRSPASFTASCAPGAALAARSPGHSAELPASPARAAREPRDRFGAGLSHLMASPAAAGLHAAGAGTGPADADAAPGSPGPGVAGHTSHDTWYAQSHAHTHGGGAGAAAVAAEMAAAPPGSALAAVAHKAVGGAVALLGGGGVGGEGVAARGGGERGWVAVGSSSGPAPALASHLSGSSYGSDASAPAVLGGAASQGRLTNQQVGQQVATRACAAGGTRGRATKDAPLCGEAGGRAPQRRRGPLPGDGCAARSLRRPRSPDLPRPARSLGGPRRP
jgi:hypothetical protein